MRKMMAILVLVTALALPLAATPSAQAWGLGDVLKVGGIGFLVDKFASPLNDFINKITFKNGGAHNYATKVVPIITVGSGGYAGAVQVIGPADLVEKTQAVFQVEGNFNGDTFRARALIPGDSKNPAKFSRVQGVGVSALIDIRI